MLLACNAIDRGNSVNIINNDRLLHWYASVIFGWSLFFAGICIPVFHVWLAIPLGEVAIGTGVCCAPQLLFIPMLYSARNTPNSPYGFIGRRIAAVIGLLLTSTLSLFLYIQTRWPNSGAANENRRIVLFSILGLYGMMALCAIIFKRQARRLVIAMQFWNVREGDGSTRGHLSSGRN